MRKHTGRPWRNLILFGVCALLVGLIVGLAGLIRRRAAGYLHPPRLSRPAGDTPAGLGVAFEEIALITADGLALASWYTPSSNTTVILVAHGYAGARSPEMHALFARESYGVVSWDFRAHGESEGDLCSMGYHEALDVEAALDFALAQPGVAQVGAWGGSMGAVSVIQAAARRPELEAIVVDSAFPTLQEVLEMTVSSPILRPLIRFAAEREAGLGIHELRPVDEIGRISPRPVLIIQGAADTAIPADSAGRLYDAAGEPRTLWIEPRVGHVGIYGARPEDYRRRVIGFFEAAFAGNS